MPFKLIVSIYLTTIFLTGLFFVQPPNQPIALAEIITAPSTLEIINQVNKDDVDVIYLGENHDSLAIHQQQLEIISQLQQNTSGSRELAIALEMFQRPFQPILDRYLEGTITEKQLREQTEYDARWGFDWEFYAPILRFSQVHQIPLIALNTPEEITQKVAKLGLDSLEGGDFRYIPPRKEIKLDNAEYRQRLEDIYQQHVEEGQGNSSDANNFFATQVLWDETMAEAIAVYLQNHPRSQIVVLVGKAHIMFDYAIPNRVARRINSPSFTQRSFLLAEK
jgi:uncharacterized iron-regulated protein